MSASGTSETEGGSGIENGKSPYDPPRLVHFGSVRDLTAAGSGKHPENPGADEANNKRRFP